MVFEINGKLLEQPREIPPPYSTRTRGLYAPLYRRDLSARGATPPTSGRASKCPDTWLSPSLLSSRISRVQKSPLSLDRRDQAFYRGATARLIIAKGARFECYQWRELEVTVIDLRGM